MAPLSLAQCEEVLLSKVILIITLGIGNFNLLFAGKETTLEGLMLMLKLKLQYFGHLMQRANSLEKTLMLGKVEGRKRRG